MSWLQISFITTKKIDRLEQGLLNCGSLSTSFFDALDEPILEPLPGQTPMWQTVKMVALFPSDCNVMHIANQLWDINDSLEIFYEHILPKDWQQCWQDHFETKHFTRFSIYPEGQTGEHDNLPVHIVPGLAFGTGNHETTHLCLDWLDKQDLRGKEVIDFGCGSGILGITAKKLGASQVWAIDHDPQALMSTQNNAALNDISEDTLHAVMPEDLPSNTQFDFLMANILANPLMDMAQMFSQILRSGGRFVISGILSTQLQEVRSVYERYFIELDPVIDGDWASLSGLKA